MAETFLRHRIVDISYRAEWIECECGVVVTAPPDRFLYDRHLPLVDAWTRHRGATPNWRSLPRPNARKATDRGYALSTEDRRMLSLLDR